MKLSKFIFGRKTTYLIVKQELFMIILMERVKFRETGYLLITLTFLGAAHELYKITGDKQYLDDAVKAANFVVEQLSQNEGLLPDAVSGDGGLFHGIFFRYFVKLINDHSVDYSDRKKFHEYITRCATVMATQGINPNTMLYGGRWRKLPCR